MSVAFMIFDLGSSIQECEFGMSKDASTMIF
jgi:hypothetical protein